jgi:hypothetical protein
VHGFDSRTRCGVFPRNTAKPRAFPDKFLTKKLPEGNQKAVDSELIVAAQDSTTSNPLASAGTYQTGARTAKPKAERIAAFLLI